MRAHAELGRRLSTAQPATWVTAFSSMFMHGGILHLGGNMLFLWIFGNNVEDSMGPVKYAAFYLLGGLAAIAAQIAIEPDSAVPTIGASGAVAAVLGGYILLYPKASVVTLIFIIFFFTIVELPALLILGFWFLQQVAFGAYGVTNPSGGGGGVAYFAHIGGFASACLRSSSSPAAQGLQPAAEVPRVLDARRAPRVGARLHRDPRAR